MATTHVGRGTPLPLKDFVEKNELPAVVEVACTDDLLNSTDTTTHNIQVGCVLQLVRTTQAIEICVDPDYVVLTEQEQDRVFLPLDYEGTFQTVPMYGTDFEFQTVTDLLKVSPRFVKSGVSFAIPGVTQVQKGDTLEVSGRVQCADNNIYLLCKHENENTDIFLPLTFAGLFTEVADPTEYTIGEICSRLPKKVKFSRDTLSRRREGQLPIEGVARDLDEEFILQTASTVEIRELASTNQGCQIPLDLPIEVIPRSDYREEDFAPKINIHEVKNQGEQLPLVVRVMDQASELPGITFPKETLLQVHRFKFTRKLLASSQDGEHFLFPDCYDGEFRLSPRSFATAHDLWKARVKVPVRVTKAWGDPNANLSCVEEGDVLSIRGISEDNEREGTLICSKLTSDGSEQEMIQLPLDAACDFVETESVDCKLSQIQSHQLPAVLELLEKSSSGIEFGNEPAVGEQLTLTKIVKSCAVVVSCQEGPDSAEMYEILEEFPLNVQLLRTKECRTKLRGVHCNDRIEKLTPSQAEVILPKERKLTPGDTSENQTSDSETAALSDCNAQSSENVGGDTDLVNDDPMYFVLDQAPAPSDEQSDDTETGQSTQECGVTDDPFYFVLEKSDSCQDGDEEVGDDGALKDTDSDNDDSLRHSEEGNTLEVPGQSRVALKRDRKLGKRRSKLVSSQFIEDVLKTGVPTEQLKQKDGNHPGDSVDISRYTVRQLSTFLRLLAIREDVISSLYNERINGNDLCLLQTSELRERFKMSAKEIELVEPFIVESEVYSDSENIYEYI
ncbi:uncharacterized protein [Ptychodera flava]|uniref:uncharacterized protein n=1 Tax=Ptychodera flava TaxID=63121 RepID=UPI00396A3D03